jgi:hypothetical protein
MSMRDCINSVCAYEKEKKKKSPLSSDIIRFGHMYTSRKPTLNE